MAAAASMFAIAAAAILSSARGALLDLPAGRGGPALDARTDKFIAGVPVLNYDRAYRGMPLDNPSLQVNSAARTADWIVVLNPEATEEQIREMCEQASTGCFQAGHQGSFPFAAIRGSEGELASAVAPHSHLARYIQPDEVVSLEPEEELLRSQSSAEPVTLWGLERVGRYKAEFTGRGVHVYVADTGIRLDHVEFGGRAFAFIDVFADTNSTNLCSSSEDPACSGDRQGHGTHCAGTVAGETYGVAPDAVLHAVKVLSDQGSGSIAGIISALDLLAMYAQKPAVASMSLGGPAPSPSEKDAVDALTASGVTVVVSAGNNYKDACIKSPAYIASAITVGSTAQLIEEGDNGSSTRTDVRSGFSNFGVCVDIWAPGSDILSADGTAETDNNYSSRTLSGTSMSCPHVSGGAALLLEADPTLTSAQVLARMYADASVNYIEDLSPTDENNLLLYVGRDAPEEPQPNRTISWPPEEFFESCEAKGQSGPRGDYPVCMCADRNTNRVNGSRCYNGYTLGCPLGAALEELDSTSPTNLSWFFFIWNCTECNCYAEGQAPVAPTYTPTPSPLPEPTPEPTPEEGSDIIAAVAVAVVVMAVAATVYFSCASGVSIREWQDGTTSRGGGDQEVELRHTEASLS